MPPNGGLLTTESGNMAAHGRLSTRVTAATSSLNSVTVFGSHGAQALTTTSAVVFAPTTANLARSRTFPEIGATFGVVVGRPGIPGGPVVVVNAKTIEDARPKIKFINRRRTVTCEVEEIFKDRFTALYWDPSRGRRRVRFRIDALAVDDLPCLEERAQFYWSVGDEVREDGSKATASLISFRRTSKVPAEQWQRAIDEASEAALDLGWELVSASDFDSVAQDDKDSAGSEPSDINPDTHRS